jgi:hypothetical protein
LSPAAAASSSTATSATAQFDESFEPWEYKRTRILAKYTTNEKLSITTSFLSSAKGATVVSTANTTSDKVKSRLEQLDDFEEGSVQEMLDLSQQEYINRIQELNAVRFLRCVRGCKGTHYLLNALHRSLWLHGMATSA